MNLCLDLRDRLFSVIGIINIVFYVFDSITSSKVEKGIVPLSLFSSLYYSWQKCGFGGGVWTSPPALCHCYCNAYVTVSSRGLVSHYIFYTKIVYVPIVCDHTYISYYTCRKTLHLLHKHILLLTETFIENDFYRQ